MLAWIFGLPPFIRLRPEPGISGVARDKWQVLGEAGAGAAHNRLAIDSA